GTDTELSGNEDPSILHAYVAFLPSRVAYKEVSKFRKRMRYIEFFVKVAEKGLSEGHYDLVIEWTKETTDYLDKRNELYTGVKHPKIKDGGGGGGGGAAVFRQIPGASVSEFRAGQGAEGDSSHRGGGGGKKRQQGGNQQQAKKKYKDFYHPSMKDLPPETLAAYKPMRTTPTMTDSQRQLQEEVETKALEVLSAYLPELVKRHSKRKRFRKLCAEERPWRSDMCLVLGLAHFGNFISKFDLRLRQLGIPSNIHKSSYMDPEWFTMDSVGALLFNWQRAKSGEDTSGPAVGLKAARLAPSGSMAAKSSMDRAAAACLGNPTAEDFLRSVKIVAVVGNEEANRLAKEKLFKDSEESAAEAAGAAKVPRSARGAGKKGVDFEGGSGGPPVTPAMLYDCLDRSFRCLRRAAVLAGRGGHWSLLLRCGQTVWSCLQTALMQVGCHQQAMDSSALRRTAWEAMSLVCDYLCDCLQSLQAEAAAAAVKRVGASLPTDLPPFNGGPELESGGASLRFDADMDDASTVDLRWLRKFVLSTLEVLHQERRWSGWWTLDYGSMLSP
uniref:UDENN domain-containing protein n=1 Tax=Macrostomum lignano TaxID=282301 RepID=A0A1I8IMC1_9PLAT